MANFTTHATAKILGYLLGDSTYRTANPLPATFYVGLSSTQPAVDGTGVTEPGWTNYARQAVEWDAATEGSPSSVVNSNAESFGDPDTAETFRYMFISDDATGGNVWFFDDLGADIMTSDTINDPVSFPAGDLSVTLQ